METVTSADGTTIAWERHGAGPPLVVVPGTLCDRTAFRPLAAQLADRCTVVTYDRRGRGDSTGTPPFSVAREVEDLAALLAATGPAAVYGHSSGAALALHAAAAGLPVTRLALHDPPVPGDASRAESRAFTARTAELIAAGRPGDALTLFFDDLGMPAPTDPATLRMAPTLVYDFTALDADEVALARAVPVPVLLVAGEQSPPFMLAVARRLADALPDGRLAVLAQGHDPDPALLADLLADFLA